MSDRWHEIATARRQTELAAFLAKPEPQVTDEDRQTGERFEQWDAVRRAKEAARIVRQDRLNDPELWTRAPILPRRTSIETAPVPAPYLEWLTTGRTRMDPEFVKDSAAWHPPTIHTQQDRDEWAAETEDDYQGGPVEVWDADEDHHQLSA